MGGDFGVRQSVRQYLKKSPFWSEALIVGCQFCQKLKSERSIKNELIWNSGTQEVWKTAWNQAPDTVPVMTKGLFKGAIVPFALFS
jgi:hypothetical protein